MLDDHPVIHGVTNFSRFEYRVSGNGDLQIDLDGLRSDLLVTIEADPGLEPELLDEYGVQDAVALNFARNSR